MNVIIGPVLVRGGAYAFNAWTPDRGLIRGYAYLRIDDAYYARHAMLAEERETADREPLVCDTLDAFRAEVSACDAVARLSAIESRGPIDRRRRARGPMELAKAS
jgi:hypothetical protein